MVSSVLSSRTRYVNRFIFIFVSDQLSHAQHTIGVSGNLTTSSRDVLKNKLSHPGTISIHWFDNFARTFARQNIYLDRDQFVSMLWTAHGVKVWPGQSPVTMSYVYNGDIPIRAMPPPLIHYIGCYDFLCSW